VLWWHRALARNERQGMEHTKGIIRRLEKLTEHGHRLSEVFTDWVAAMALAYAGVGDVHAAVTGIRDTREAEYLRIARKYGAEMALLAEATGLLAMVFEDGPGDHLGRLYMDIGTPNDRLGQFFTPYEVSRAMAAMSLSDMSELLATRDYIPLGEPACGSCGMVIAVAEEMRARGHNPQQQLVVHATDLSMTAVHMAYVQLTLMHIPAMVVHGNTLTLEAFSVWCTFSWSAGHWDLRRPFRERGRTTLDTDPMPVVDVAVEQGQLQLFGGLHG